MTQLRPSFAWTFRSRLIRYSKTSAILLIWLIASCISLTIIFNKWSTSTKKLISLKNSNKTTKSNTSSSKRAEKSKTKKPTICAKSKSHNSTINSTTNSSVHSYLPSLRHPHPQTRKRIKIPYSLQSKTPQRQKHRRQERPPRNKPRHVKQPRQQYSLHDLQHSNRSKSRLLQIKQPQIRRQP